MHFAQRRERLLKTLDRPLLLFAGGTIGRNYPANAYPFRADSHFLYFFESPEPGAAAWFDPGEKSVTLFLPERTVDDALWHGAVPSFAEEQARHAVAQVLPVEALESHVARLAAGRQVDTVAVADPVTTRRAREITGADVAFEVGRVTRVEVARALAALRLFKDNHELAQMRETAKVTHDAHLLAITHSRAGVAEQHLAGFVEGTFAREGCVPAYGTILSVRGEILHSRTHFNTLANGDIVLLDGGAENHHGYCSDVTRCWPVGGFSTQGREIYELVLKAQLDAIAQVRPGVRYRDLHLRAARVFAEGLVQLGLMNGAPEALVESGATAMFFPHGLGHQIGLDVHDLESFGDAIHYPGRQRSQQFGLGFLRMDMDLQVDMTFTIEPGLYFVPAILRNPEFIARFKGQVNFAAAEKYLAMNQGRGFGGIRIEDDIRCTASGAEVLTASIPKATREIEALVGTA